MTIFTQGNEHKIEFSADELDRFSRERLSQTENIFAFICITAFYGTVLCGWIMAIRYLF